MKERFDPLAEPVRCLHATYDNHMHGNQLYSLYITEIIMRMKRLTKVTSTCTVSVWLNIQLTWHGSECGCNVQPLTFFSGNFRVISESSSVLNLNTIVSPCSRDESESLTYFV